MNTVARYMKEIGKNVKVENLPAAELDHLLSLSRPRGSTLTSRIVWR